MHDLGYGCNGEFVAEVDRCEVDALMGDFSPEVQCVSGAVTTEATEDVASQMHGEAGLRGILHNTGTTGIGFAAAERAAAAPLILAHVRGMEVEQLKDFANRYSLANGCVIELHFFEAVVGLGLVDF